MGKRKTVIPVNQHPSEHRSGPNDETTSMPIKTQTEKNQHPKARLIPDSMWCDNYLFCESLSDELLELMDIDDTEQLFSALKKIASTWNGKELALLVIVLSHPNLELSTVRKIAGVLGLSASELFKLFTVLGNMPYIKVMIECPYYDINNLINKVNYWCAAKHGHLEVLEYFENKAPCTVKKEIESWYVDCYSSAANNGYLEVLKYFEAQASTRVQDMIKADSFSAYWRAAGYGHLKVLKHLEDQASMPVEDMIKAVNFLAYSFAAENGHLKVLKHLEKRASNDIQAMIKSRQFGAFQHSFANSHFQVSKHLLHKSSACLDFADKVSREYGVFTNLFIQESLVMLRQEASYSVARWAFDISNSEYAKVCFFIVRNLIRRNDRVLDEDIRFLLSIPSVELLAHQSVNKGPSNELVRFAAAEGNTEAVKILLNIPSVRIIAKENDYYRNDIGMRLDIASIERGSDLSKTDLSQASVTNNSFFKSIEDSNRLLDEAFKPHIPQ